jgi:hypothetical protein
MGTGLKVTYSNGGVINSNTHFNINGAAKPLAFPKVSIIADNYIFLYESL